MLKKTDFYKADHRRQYPDGTELVFSNWTARKSRIEGVNHFVFFGLQAYLMKMAAGWEAEFFARPLPVVRDSYQQRLSNAGIEITYEHVDYLHSLGCLPLEVWALPEGTHVPIGVPMFVMWNTDPNCFWLTNYIETSMSSNVWGPCTSATLAYQYRKVLDASAARTGGDPGFVDFQGHDFSYRGMYGDDAAAMSGAGHLLSFKGTDTMPALDFLEKYYQGDPVTMGGSVPATEHSVMCMGTKENEVETYRRLITEIYPTGVVSVVSDTWDYWKILTETLPKLKHEIMARDGKLVIRPDSGDPVKILCGDPDATGPAKAGTFNLLWETFGGHVTDEGFRQLDPHIGAIYGDSITIERCREIVRRLEADKFVPSMVLGIGSYTYQMVTRDTGGFALKSTAGIVNGEVREIFKDPVTDSGEKKSAKGFTAVYWGAQGLTLRDGVSLAEVKRCAFRQAFVEGVPIAMWNLEGIRCRVTAGPTP